jgi:nitric oxide reductase large subunit
MSPRFAAYFFGIAVSSGVFGFLINLPIVSYYEIGTALTANHAHASMMGVYGMLAVGLALFCLRYMIRRIAGRIVRQESAFGH